MKRIVLSLALLLSLHSAAHAQSLTGKVASVYTWAFPVLENYRMMMEQAVNTEGALYLGPFNTVHHDLQNMGGCVTTAWLDLRQEPIVITIPPMPDSLYSVMRISDMQTYTTAEFVQRPGTYVVVRKGKHTVTGKADSIIVCESDYISLHGWTQVRNADTSKTMNALRAMSIRPAGETMTVTSLSNMYPVSPAFPPYSLRTFTSVEVLPILGQIVSFMDIHPDDRNVALSLMQLRAMTADTINIGIAGALARIAGSMKEMGRLSNGWTITEGLYGPRSTFNGDHLRRAAACMDGLFGPTDRETLVAFLFMPTPSFTISIDKSSLPSVKRYWSISIDGMQESILSSTELRRNKKGGIDIVVSPTTPASVGTSNWLRSSPNGTVGVTMLMHAPNDVMFTKKWNAPVVHVTTPR